MLRFVAELRRAPRLARVDLMRHEIPETDPDKPLVALAFKLDDGRYGQLTYIRVYQGTIEKGSTIVNARTKRRVFRFEL